MEQSEKLPERKFQVLNIIVLLSTIIMVVINILANVVKFGGVTTAEISDKYSNYFVPAGYVFSIWGIIYIALIIYSIFQLRRVNLDNPKLKSIRIAYILSSIVNSAWIFFWHFDMLEFTVPLMIILLACLIYIYVKIFDLTATKSFKNLVQVPFSIYLGWISVATIANISAFLTSINWDGASISSLSWSVIMITIAGILGVAMLITKSDYVYTFVIIWALVGIAVKFYAVELNVSIVATVVAILVSFILLIKFFRVKASS